MPAKPSPAKLSPAKLSILLLLTVAGCAQDPYQRSNTWSLPQSGLGANDANLRAMLVNPNDQIAGSGDDTSLGPLAAHPVDALVTGRRRALPSANASTIGANAPQQGPQGGQADPGQAGIGPQ